ncbi:MAG: hypothetical protein A2Y00_08210 [Omnitrophica WOR_2 bacterium GWF2_43_52]|nr:MAG: hypothetical protein A2062_02945 [Omnitrophica WOR_2 bacterium GWA2_44_7]OGX02788.1 MAG: hypothetical protein A2062_02955 [Omnitrophica WOR_2 bacterium GWA2_44_7]OGX16103.1 MAG: hypothetical protein A2Y01_00340 [Omnitrophica WOR_2 bacterium GWC2_44_8]OGX21455.1 MAG: hypothetical protein A2Y00_08210 [Omnitrophica WOR_2 bacterium GWF2_43_52]
MANVNIEKPVVDSLLKKGFDVKWVTDIDKKMPDTRVCEIANSENRIILTNDKDFGEIVFLQKKIVQGIVLLRIKGQDAMEKAGLIERLLDKYPSKIIRHFVVVTKEKFRFIPLEVA